MVFAAPRDGFARLTAGFAVPTVVFARETECFATPPPDIAAPTDDIAAGAAGFAAPTAAFARATECFVLGEDEVVRQFLAPLLSSAAAIDKLVERSFCLRAVEQSSMFITRQFEKPGFFTTGAGEDFFFEQPP